MKSTILVVLMIVSVFSGCLGNSDEIDEKNDIITNLENEIINLNQENENLSGQIESMDENLVLMDNIEQIGSSDFLFYCDFNDTDDGKANSLLIKLDNEPDGVRNIRWKPNRLDYLIRK